MFKNCDGQVSLFDSDSVLYPGCYVSSHGRLLSFDEIVQRVGKIIIYNVSTESHSSFLAVRVEQIYIYPDGRRRLIYFDGSKQRGLVDEMYFTYSGRFPARAYEVV